jgi:hypothetical protein
MCNHSCVPHSSLSLSLKCFAKQQVYLFWFKMGYMCPSRCLDIFRILLGHFFASVHSYCFSTQWLVQGSYDQVIFEEDASVVQVSSEDPSLLLAM